MGGEAEFADEIGDGPLVKKTVFLLERNGASVSCVDASVCLDNANVVIDGMTPHPMAW